MNYKLMFRHKKILFIFCVIISCISIVKLDFLSSNKLFLNMVARIYFDERYYLSEYPEVSEFKISPFKHYSKFGWKEGKNPFKDFDNNFYKRFYESWDRSMKGLNPLQHSISCKMKFETCYINPNQLSKVTLLKDAKYYISLTSIFRNEARFLKEWIEFYRLIGVEHFYLYNHLSTDNYMEVLEPYINDGIVELVDIKIEPHTLIEWNDIQSNAYNDAVAKSKNISEWLVVVDTDEFLFPTQVSNLKEVLKNYDDYATLAVNFRNFGSSGIKKINKGELLIDVLTMAEELGNLHTSPIVKPRYVDYFDLPHFAKLKPGYGQITENFEYIYGPFSPYQSLQIIRANHYWSRDLDFFELTKISREHMSIYLSEDQKYIKIEQLYNRDKEISKYYDDSILRFVPSLKEVLFKGAFDAN